jgi:hypothetical protein
VQAVANRRTALAVASLVLLVSVLALGALVNGAVASAACMERARFELVSCVGPPNALAWLVAIAVLLASAVGLGMALGAPRRRRTTRDIRRR